jgi:predicted cupin superfamily sugar epimerase
MKPRNRRRRQAVPQHDDDGVAERRRFLQRAAWLCGVVLGSNIPAAGAAETAGSTGSAMINDMTADDVLKLLSLEPNATCGFVRETYRATQQIAPGGLPAPFADGRPLGSALYFMVTPQAPVRLHRIRNDQLYHYYLGDPIEVLLLRGQGEHVIVGPDLRAGHRVQLLIPGNTIHTARIVGSKRWFLGASTEWPGVIPADVELGKPEVLTAQFPNVAADIRNYPQPVD